MGDNHLFAVIFDPAEVSEALDIPPDNIHIIENTLFPGLAEINNHKTFSARTIIKQLVLGMVLTALIATVLVLLY